MIGLITYGKMTYIHELGFQDCPKCYCFRGDKEYTPKQIHDQLGIKMSTDAMAKMQQVDGGVLNRFLVPVSECEFALNSILDDL